MERLNHAIVRWQFHCLNCPQCRDWDLNGVEGPCLLGKVVIDSLKNLLNSFLK